MYVDFFNIVPRVCLFFARAKSFFVANVKHLLTFLKKFAFIRRKKYNNLIYRFYRFYERIYYA